MGQKISTTNAGMLIPDSALAREAAELVRDTENELLFNHSRRVFIFGALRGTRRDMRFDPEMLYLGAMFHDMGLTDAYKSNDKRFEVDGAIPHGLFAGPRCCRGGHQSCLAVHRASHDAGHSALHEAIIALVTAGVEIDVLGLGFETVPEHPRDRVTEEHP